MLYIVATPIGNINEITYRAVEVLKSVDAILCEDTRHSSVLLRTYGIEKPLISYQKFNERSRVSEVLQMLKDGKEIALISDAGMPMISDPGHVLLDEVIASDLPYTVVSGPCAMVNALVLSGLSTQNFVFVGFLPEKTVDKDRMIAKFCDIPSTLVFYLPLSDVDKILDYLHEKLGERRYSLVREISKKFEEVIRGRLGEKTDFVHKGEYVLVVEGAPESDQELNSLPVEEHVAFYTDGGMDKKQAIKMVAKDRGVPKSEIYAYVLGDKNKQE